MNEPAAVVLLGRRRSDVSRGLDDPAERKERQLGLLAKAKQELGFSLYERGECMTESDVDQYVTHV
jgi:hypothetical protein